MPNVPSLLLVDFFCPEHFAASRASCYPFIAGYLRERELDVEWICFSSKEQPATGNNYVLDLGESGRAALLREGRALGISHLLFSEQPSPALLDFVRAEFPGITVDQLAREEVTIRQLETNYWTDWLGLGSDGARSYLPDLAPPRYECRAMDDAVAQRNPRIVVVAGLHCVYAGPLRRNPHYEHLDLSSLRRLHGCAFCPLPPDTRYPARTPPVELVLRQIAAARQCTETIYDTGAFQIQSIATFRQLEAFVDGVVEAGYPPCRFYFNCRADELLEEVEAVDAALPRLQAHCHEFHIKAMGAENLSPRENERLNKGISNDQLLEVSRHFRRWERDYPEHFFFTANGGFGFILFTPWTTLEDLEINLAMARKLDIQSHEFFLTRRLMLMPGSAVRLLAEHDGLLAAGDAEAEERFAWLVRYCDPGSTTFADDGDPPWRFRDEKVSAVCDISVRIGGPWECVTDDPWHPRIIEAVRSVEGQLDRLDLFGLLLEEAGRPAASSSVDELLTAWLARVQQLREPRPDEESPSSAHDQAAATATRPHPSFEVFRRLQEQPEQPLCGFHLERVQEHPDRLELTFVRQDERLGLTVAPATTKRPFFVRRGTLVFSYHDDTPLDSKAKRQVLKQVIRVFSRRPGRARASE